MALRTLLIFLVFPVLLFGLGGCALQQRTASQIYVLDLAQKQSAAPVAGTGLKPKIAVSVPQTWPGFGSLEIAYTRVPNRIEYYAHSEWADNPAQMIGPLLIRALEQSGEFSAVVTPGKGIATDLRLDSEIVKIQQDFDVSPSVGRVVLRVQLIDLPTTRVIGTQTFQATVPAATDDPPGGVAAMNKALSIVLDQIVGYFKQLIAAQPKRLESRNTGFWDGRGGFVGRQPARKGRS